MRVATSVSPVAMSFQGVSSARLPLRRPSSRLSLLQPRCRLSPSFRPLRFYAAPAVVSRSSHLDQFPHSASLASTTPSIPSPIPGSSHILNILGQVHHLLTADIGGADEWRRRIELAQEDLTSPRRGSIGVYGERLAFPRDVISALLQDPLADTDISRQALLQRHVDANTDVLTLRQSEEPQRSPSGLDVPSSWLRTSKFDIQEITSANTTVVTDQLLQNDLALIVLDPYRLLSTPLLSAIIPTLVRKGPMYFVINGSLPAGLSVEDIRHEVRKQLQALVPDVSSEIPVLCIQAERALTALNALTIGISHDESPKSRAAALDIFQQDFLASQIGTLQTDLLAQTSKIALPQIATTTSLARLALDHVEEIVLRDRDLNRTATHVIDQLRQDTERAQNKVKHLSVISKGIEGGIVEGGVQHALATVQTDIEHLFHQRWSWLSLIGRLRADEVGPELRLYLEQHFGRKLEQSLIFETGQLAQIQTSLSARADSTLHQLTASHHNQQHHHNASPLASPILVNHLSTLSLSVPPITPSTLIGPIALRREQLMRVSVPRLQSAAQRSILFTLGLGVSGAAISWFAYVPPLSYLSAPTALGLGLLSFVAALNIGQTSWKRAQRRFWNDWRRITSMLKGDLESNLQDIIATRVSVKPLAAADGLEKIIARRNHRLDDLQNKINDLKERI